MDPKRYRDVESFIETLDGLEPDEESVALRSLLVADPALHGDVVRVLEPAMDETSGLPTSPIHAMAELPPIEPGSILHGRYEVTRPLGEGGMASVYLARDINFRAGDDGPGQRLVAVKAAVELNSRAFLRKEASVLLQLSHPQLPKVEATFAEEGRRFVVMTYIPGGSLRSRLDADGALAVDEVEGWMREVLGVLRYLHEPPRRWRRADPHRTRWSEGNGGDVPTRPDREPHIHRDVKPENVVLNEEGHLYVVDLGIAQSGGSRSRLVSSRQSPGTAGYAAPEVEQREGALPQSDLYGVGMTAYVLLTGTATTVWRHSATRRLKAVDGQKADPFQRVLDEADLDERMREWIRRATRLEIEERFESAAEMLEALDRALIEEDPWPRWKRMVGVGVPLAALGGVLLWASPWEGAPPDVSDEVVAADVDSTGAQAGVGLETDTVTPEVERGPLPVTAPGGGSAPPLRTPPDNQSAPPATRGGATPLSRDPTTFGDVTSPSADASPEARPPAPTTPSPSTVPLPFSVDHPVKRNLSVLVNGVARSRTAPPSVAVGQEAVFTTRDPDYRLTSATLYVDGSDPVVGYPGADEVIRVRVPAGANRVVFSIVER